MAELKLKQTKTDALRYEPIPRLVLRFASSTMLALLFSSAYTLMDALFVSWGVGDTAMGGVSVVFPFVVLQGAIASAVGGGAASIVSRKLGAGKPEEAGEVTLNAMAVFYGTAIVTTVLSFLLIDPLLAGMGVTEDLLPFAKQYFYIILAGNVFSTGFSNIIRAEGKMLYGLLIWVIPISVNIVLDIIFIFGLGWGVRGSALSTVICQFASFSMSMLFFTKFTSQKFRGAKISFRRIGQILAIGLPSLIQMGSLSIMSALLNNVLGSVGGTLGVTTFAYISKIVTFAIVPLTAFAQALAPIVGYNHGVGDKTRVKKTILLCTLLSVGYALLALVLAQAIPQYLMRIFTSDSEIIALGAGGLRVIALSLLFMPVPMLAGTAFQAIGKMAWAFIMYAANLVFLIPAALLMARAMGVNGVWWAYVIANALAGAVVPIYWAVYKNRNQDR